MGNQLVSLLQQWITQRDEYQWVLGTIYATEGPCYRKTGAMMLFNDIGQQLGMLSGGCLESDIQQHARRVMQTGHATTIRYDANDEDDIAFQLGIGCGGTVHILLQPIHASQQYLQLDTLYEHLIKREPVLYQQCIQPGPMLLPNVLLPYNPTINKPKCISEDNKTWLITPLCPPPHLMVIGGGIDAQPVIALAHQLGWQTTLWDSRPANARREFFMHTHWILRDSMETVTEHAIRYSVDAAILMTHNIAMDAAALKALQIDSIRYMALLGPKHRKEQVITASQLTESALKIPIAGPAGLSLGGELPESIALSIMAECHAVLYSASAQSLSCVL